MSDGSSDCDCDDYYSSYNIESRAINGVRDHCDGGRGGVHECDSDCEEVRYHHTRQCGRDCCGSPLSSKLRLNADSARTQSATANLSHARAAQAVQLTQAQQQVFAFQQALAEASTHQRAYTQQQALTGQHATDAYMPTTSIAPSPAVVDTKFRVVSVTPSAHSIPTQSSTGNEVAPPHSITLVLPDVLRTKREPVNQLRPSRTEQEAPVASSAIPIAVITPQSGGSTRIVSMNPAESVENPSQSQQQQQRDLKRWQKMEGQLELQELKKRKLLLENLKLELELGFITHQECLERGRRVLETEN